MSDFFLPYMIWRNILFPITQLKLGCEILCATFSTEIKDGWIPPAILEKKYYILIRPC